MHYLCRAEVVEVAIHGMLQLLARACVVERGPALHGLSGATDVTSAPWRQQAFWRPCSNQALRAAKLLRAAQLKRPPKDHIAF